MKNKGKYDLFPDTMLEKITQDYINHFNIIIGEFNAELLRKTPITTTQDNVYVKRISTKISDNNNRHFSKTITSTHPTIVPTKTVVPNTFRTNDKPQILHQDITQHGVPAQKPTNTANLPASLIFNAAKGYTIAKNPKTLQFLSQVANYSYTPDNQDITQRPYFSKALATKKDIKGQDRVAYEGMLFDKQLTLFEYRTVGGGQCGYAAVFQALPQSATPLAEPYVDVTEESSPHPFVVFLKNLAAQMNQDYLGLIFTAAEISPFFNNGTFNAITRALDSIHPKENYTLFIWLKEKNGIMLHLAPQKIDKNKKMIHIMLGNDPDTGAADGHYSLLVPENDRMLQENALHHERYVTNANKVQLGIFD